MKDGSIRAIDIRTIDYIERLRDRVLVLVRDRFWARRPLLFIDSPACLTLSTTRSAPLRTLVPARSLGRLLRSLASATSSVARRAPRATRSIVPLALFLFIGMARVCANRGPPVLSARRAPPT